MLSPAPRTLGEITNGGCNFGSLSPVFKVTAESASRKFFSRFLKVKASLAFPGFPLSPREELSAADPVFG